MPLYFIRHQPGIGLALARQLPLARRRDARADGGRGLARRPRGELGFIDGRDIEHQVEAIEQGPGELAAIARDLVGRAATLAGRMAEPAAGTGIHRRDELEAGGKFGAPGGAADVDLPALQRLAQGFEHAALELRKLVEKQRAVMRQRDFAGARAATATDQGRCRGRVMRRTERPLRPVLQSETAG